MADKKYINSNELGKDLGKGGVFGTSNLTPAGTFSNKPRFFEYNATKDSDAKITLTLERVKQSIKDQLKEEEGSGFEESDILVESFLYEFTNLLIDYRDLRNHVFFGSAYTELAYNIKWIVENYPYKFLIATETIFLDTINSEFSFTNNSALEETTFVINQSAIKDGAEEFNFYDNNINFNWLDYDLVDKNNRRYPIKNVTVPYNSASGIYIITNISTYSIINTGFTTYTTLKLTTNVPHNYIVGQGINLFDNVFSTYCRHQ